MAAGIGWTFLRHLLRPTFADYKQLRERIDLPVLGIVSLYRDPGHNRMRRFQFAGFALGVILLFGVFGSTVLFHEGGSSMVRQLIGKGEV